MTTEQLEALPSSDPDPLALLLELEDLVDSGNTTDATNLLQDRCACGRNKCCSSTPQS